MTTHGQSHHFILVGFGKVREIKRAWMIFLHFWIWTIFPTMETMTFSCHVLGSSHLEKLKHNIYRIYSCTNFSAPYTKICKLYYCQIYSYCICTVWITAVKSTAQNVPKGITIIVYGHMRNRKKAFRTGKLPDTRLFSHSLTLRLLGKEFDLSAYLALVSLAHNWDFWLQRATLTCFKRTMKNSF